MTIPTNTLFPNGAPPAPPEMAMRKRLTALGERAEECLIRALAESHLNEAVRKEVGRMWGEYKQAVERALQQMVEAAVDEMLTTKESFAKLQEVVNRLIKENVHPIIGKEVSAMNGSFGNHNQRINALEDRVAEFEKIDGPNFVTRLCYVEAMVESLTHSPEKRVERGKKGR
jgi:hypothetical protein